MTRFPGRAEKLTESSVSLASYENPACLEVIQGLRFNSCQPAADINVVRQEIILIQTAVMANA